MLRSAISLWLAVNAPTTVPKINRHTVRHCHTFAQSAMADAPRYLTDPEIHFRLEKLYIDLAHRQPLQFCEYEYQNARKPTNQALAYSILRLACELYSKDSELHRDLARLRNYETADRFLQDLAYGETPFDTER